MVAEANINLFMLSLTVSQYTIYSNPKKKRQNLGCKLRLTENLNFVFIQVVYRRYVTELYPYILFLIIIPSWLAKSIYFSIINVHLLTI